ncbi:hypothetical protein JCM10908_005043 [Rhodotorula pacifica]|uniref:uncharacterized protein n=1 Tax=Rhodotorula pacifica TaxID=1495444 RepID=UPI00317F3CDD
MFFHRPAITPSWNQRIYPVREPSFAAPSSPQSHQPSEPSSPSGTTSSRPRARSSGAPGEVTFAAEPAPRAPVREAPPPIYYPGPAQRRLSAAARGIDESVPRGHIASINSATTSTCIVKWLKHPAAREATRPRDPESQTPQKRKGLKENWRSWIRLPLIWSALREEREVLWDGWPIEFGGTRPVPWEAAIASREAGGATSAEEGAALTPRLAHRGAPSIDSGVALSPMPSADNPPLHPLEAQYRRRIAELNTVISESLVLTRLWLALTELTDIIWLICLIIALGTGGGKQTGFLKGVEVGLVLVILVNGLAINGVRMRRYTLAKALKARTRDWSPLPITSSTNSGLMRNYLDGDASDRDRTESMPPKEGPVMRWRLRETEGGYWLAYRPIVRCELVVPSAYSYHALQARIEHMPVLEHSVSLASDSARPSTSTESGAAPASAGAVEPPKYEDAV